MVYGGHTLEMVLGGRIPEFTYVGAPPFISGHGQVFRPRNLGPMVYGEPTHGTTHVGRIEEFINMGGSIPSITFGHGWVPILEAWVLW